MSYSLASIEMAYAKVNLALHLVARLPNGYHQLDSVVAFVDLGDILEARADNEGTICLTIGGEYGEELSTVDNLVVRAGRLLQQHAQTPMGAHIRLTKHIPVGAGLGGGSADAAAAMRLLNRVWNLRYSDAMLAELAEQLGADVPACVFSQAARMEGIGEVLTPLPHLPSQSLVLIYPNAPLWTPDVYRAMHEKPFSGVLSEVPTMGADKGMWLDWLKHTSNDLEHAAHTLSPHIADMLRSLSAVDGCKLARMSGSGSACFGLFDSAEAASRGEQAIQSAQPDWWVRASHIKTII